MNYFSLGASRVRDAARRTLHRFLARFLIAVCTWFYASFSGFSNLFAIPTPLLHRKTAFASPPIFGRGITVRASGSV